MKAGCKKAGPRKAGSKKAVRADCWSERAPSTVRPPISACHVMQSGLHFKRVAASTKARGCCSSKIHHRYGAPAIAEAAKQRICCWAAAAGRLLLQVAAALRRISKGSAAGRLGCAPGGSSAALPSLLAQGPGGAEAPGCAGRVEQSQAKDRSPSSASGSKEEAAESRAGPSPTTCVAI